VELPCPRRGLDPSGSRVVSAGANTHDAPLPALTLDTLARLEPLPQQPSNRAWLRRRGIRARIARRGIESSTRLGRYRWGGAGAVVLSAAGGAMGPRLGAVLAFLLPACAPRLLQPTLARHKGEPTSNGSLSRAAAISCDRSAGVRVRKEGHEHQESRGNPTAQVSVLREDASAPVVPQSPSRSPTSTPSMPRRCGVALRSCIR
jgi:hypothetical protein